MLQNLGENGRPVNLLICIFWVSGFGSARAADVEEDAREDDDIDEESLISSRRLLIVQSYFDIFGEFQYCFVVESEAVALDTVLGLHMCSY